TLGSSALAGALSSVTLGVQFHFARVLGPVVAGRADSPADDHPGGPGSGPAGKGIRRATAEGPSSPDVLAASLVVLIFATALRRAVVPVLDASKFAEQIVF